MSDAPLPTIHIDEILAYAVAQMASDVHLSEGELVGMRVHGHLGKLTQAPVVTPDMMHELVRQLYRYDDVKFEAFRAKRDADFAYVIPDGTPFRVNVFFKLGKMAAVLRRIERNAKRMEDLGLPAGLSKILEAKQGLFLVTGPTGSGKSTTLVSMLDKINETRPEHVITVEDPVEFIFTDKKSVFSQREVGRDTESFIAAIRGAMREDPDIVLVGEMRDKETVEAAVNLAETGHLVFSTLHTSGSVQTISRIVQFFPPDIQTQVRVRLADSLLGVLSQRLLPRVDKPGRVGIHELMYITPAIRNLIKTGDLVQINNNIELGSQEGMVTMRSSCEKLTQRGIVKEEDWIGYFTNDN